MADLELKDIVSLSLGVMGFSIACFTFFLTQMRSPKIEVQIGSNLTLYHPSDGGFAMYPSLSFSNSTKRGGSVEQVSVSGLGYLTGLASSRGQGS